jgi:uncharacterized membrane protein YphA (DoxX/SURF4 family)
MKLASQLLLRYSWSLLFVWFGTQQLLHPSAWTAFLPAWTGYFPIPADMLIQLNGWMEICAAILLAIGYGTRLMAAFLALHLAGIAVSVGGAIGVRDAVLSAAGFSLALAGPDAWSADIFLKRPKNPSENEQGA